MYFISIYNNNNNKFKNLVLIKVVAMFIYRGKCFLNNVQQWAVQQHVVRACQHTHSLQNVCVCDVVRVPVYVEM